MPMYEYGCQECETQFTLLRRMDQNDQDIICPDCRSNRVQRQFSVFASVGKNDQTLESIPISGGGGCCGGGSCGCASTN